MGREGREFVTLLYSISKLTIFEEASEQLEVPTSEALPALRSSIINLGDLDAELPSLDGSDISSISSALERLQTPGPEVQTNFQDEHVWDLVLQDVILPKQKVLTSWDTFSDSSAKPFKSPYLSEQPQEIFAAALRRYHGRTARCTLRPGVLLPALSLLGLGRPSRLFEIDGNTGTATSTLEQFEELGIDSTTLEQIINDFRRWSLHWWRLRQFQRRHFSDSPSQKTLSAFVYALRETLHGIETRLVELSSSSQSLLQLHESYHPVEPLLQALVRLIDSASSQESFFSTLVQEAEIIISSEDWIYHVMRETLRLCARPSLMVIATSVGLDSKIDSKQST